MKILHVLMLGLLISFSQLTAQTTTLLTGLANPREMVVHPNHENIIYVAETNGNSVSKITLTSSGATKKTLTTGVYNPNGIEFVNEKHLLVTQSPSKKLVYIELDDAGDMVSKEYLDLGTNKKLTLMSIAATNEAFFLSDRDNGRIIAAGAMGINENYITGLNEPMGIALYGSTLYIAESKLGKAKISKVDTNSSNPTIVDVISSELLTPMALTVIGDELYITDSFKNTIYKIDLTKTNPTLKEVVTNIDKLPWGTVATGGYLYFNTIENGGRFLRLNSALSVKEVPTSIEVSAYPNPTQNKLYLQGITEELTYSIYNMVGQEVMKGRYQAKEGIQVSGLEKGVYVVKTENKHNIKFVKE